MITVLIITTSILVGVSVKLYLDKQDLKEELDNLIDEREGHYKDRYFLVSSLLDDAYKTLSKYYSEREDLREKVAALELINEGCTNTYFNQANKIFELSAKLSTLRNELKKERNKANQIKYDKQNNTIVDPEYLTELGNL